MKSEESELHQTRERLRREAESGGYHLNPDPQFTLALVKGLLTNQRSYGYRACSCRLASGSGAGRETEADRHPGAPPAGGGGHLAPGGLTPGGSSPPVGRRRQAAGGNVGARPALPRMALPGVRARDAPPEVCPICKAQKERFERFL
jgi:ferredoxin-thioredoxin reductase catalytic chain